ncbi:mechanosensitive ion channel family protein [Legionella israelensis]|uniref:Mechanosensitive ion channel family protein n=2 Tax=Legionella israelensis TaxID=454 RepID=A0AAX1EIL4_9GAMM|nr:mechanosensitive ion channel family protein [Legionella israelensis]
MYHIYFYLKEIAMFNLNFLLGENFWLLHCFVLLFLTAGLHFLSRYILKHLLRKAEQTRIIYDEALLRAIKAPLILMIWFTGLSATSLLVLSHNSPWSISEYLSPIKKLAIIFSASWFIVRFIHQIEAFYIRFCAENCKEVDKTLIRALTQLITIITIILGVLAVMQLFGLPISGLLAFGGIGGAAVAFASRDLLANLFGGLVVYLDRPFKIGDWIRSPDKQIEGTVECIGWRVTCIRTFDKRPLYVPNGVFLNISVENASRMLNRRIKTTIGIRYQDAGKIDKITQQIRQMLLEHPEIDTQQTIIVNFIEFGHSSLNFMVYAFTKTTQWVKFQAVQHDVFIKIIRIISANNAECAFPTQTLFLQNESAINPLAQEIEKNSVFDTNG